MKTTILYISLLFLFFTSCVEDAEYETVYKIKNNSNHTIKFDFFSNSDISSFILENDDLKEYINTPRGSFNNFFPFEGIDSIKVSFDGTISVFHGSTLYNLERNLLLRSSYIQIKDEEFLREFDYSFTDDDYQESLLLQ